MKKLNIAVLIVMLVFQTILSPMVYAVDTTGGTTQASSASADIENPNDEGEEAEDPDSSGESQDEPILEETSTQETTDTPNDPTGGPTAESNGEQTKVQKGVQEEANSKALKPLKNEAPVKLASVGEGTELNASLSGLVVKINDQLVEGNKVDTPLDQNSTVSIDFTFAVPLTNPKKGDYFTFTLPPSLVDWDGKFAGSQSKIGETIPGFKWETENNEVTLTFTEIDDSFSGNAEIKINFQSGFTFDQNAEDLDQTLDIPKVGGGKDSISLTFLPSTSNKKLVTKEAKNSVAIIENGERYFTWEVWVNEAGKSLTDATLVDTPTGGHALDGDITVEKYEVGLKGPKGTPISTNQYGNFGAITLDGNHAYKITYRTKVTLDEEKRDGKKDFTNKISLKSGETTIDESTSGTVTTTYGKSLEKELKDNTNYESNWEIRYNYNQLRIDKANAYITDTITGPHKIDVSQIKVYKMTVGENGEGQGEGQEVSNYTVTPATGLSNTFRLEFDNNITDAYRIVYPAVYVEGDFLTEEKTIENLAVSGTKTIAPISRGLSQGILTKRHSVDYDKQEITWTITIKADNEAINGLELVDNFEDGAKNGVHTLINGLNGIQVTGALNAGTKELLDPNDLTKGFKITGMNIAKDQIATVTYTTKYNVIDDGSVDNQGYGNTANTTWKSGGKDYVLTVKDSYTPESTTQNNGRKWGSFDYKTQLFTWNVVVNANKKDIKGAVLTDTLGAGHEIVPGTFKVHEYTRTGDTTGTIGGELASGNYVISILDENKKYTLTFDSDLAADKNNKSYIVTYNTKDSDNILGIESDTASDKGNVYRNEATFKAVGEKVHKLESPPVEIDENVANNLIGKSVQGNTGSNNNGILTWTLDVNRSHSDLKNVVVTDTPSESLILDRNSIKVREFVVSDNGISEGGTWRNPGENEIVTFKENGGFTIEFGNLERKGYQVQYKTLVIEAKKNETSPRNNAEINFTGDENVKDNQKTDNQYSSNYAFSRSMAGFSLTKGGVKFQKVGQNIVTGDKTALENVEFGLYIQGTNTLVRDNIKSGTDGYFEINNINYGNYTLKEKAAPAGYQKADFDFTLNAESDITIAVNEVIELVNKKAEVIGTKKWVGGPASKPTIQLQLLQNEIPFGAPVSLEDGKTSYKWSDLPVSKGNGEDHKYTVDEVNVPANYKKTISADGLTVTNTYVSPKTEVTGTKEWVNGPEEKPTIHLQLYRNGDKHGDAVPLNNGETRYTWTGLDENDHDGKPYVYTVKEVDPPANYVPTHDGLTVTNSYVIPKINITGTKVWVNGSEDRPTIELQLYKDGNPEGDPVELRSGKTSHTWENLDATDINGKPHKYTVNEVEVPENYNRSVSEDGLTITNTYVIPKTQVEGKKVWVGGPSQKPTIELQLYQDGNPYGSPVELKNGTESHVWKDLDATDINGKYYSYTVDEVNTPSNYRKTISPDGLTVTNTYVSPKTSVTGTKVWENGPKPDIQLQLFRNGEKHGDPVTLEKGTESYTWTGIDLTDNRGNKYVYTVDEVNVPANYVKKVSADGLTVTNTYVIPKTEVTGTKKWMNGPEEKPTIQLQLFQDGKAYGDPVELTNGTESYTWKDLDATDIDGNEYTYTVDEVNTPTNYAKTNSADGLTVTNTYVIPKINITGTKKWVNGSEERPTIELQLFQNGVAYGDPVELTSGNTSYTWENLDATDINGNPHKYTVNEVKVPTNYNSSVSEDGLTITNTYVIPKTEVKGTKVWVGGPKEKPTIQMQLKQDGKAYGDPVTLKNGKESYTWKDLDATDDTGNYYTYTVDEVKVPDNYVKTVSPDGLTITNKYKKVLGEDVNDSSNGINNNSSNIKGDNEALASGRLPQTDGANQTWMTIVGLILVAFSVMFLIRRRKKASL